MATSLHSTGTADSLPHRAISALPETCRAEATIIDAGHRALYLGPSFTLGAHRNAVAVLAVGLEAPFTLHPERRSAAPTTDTPSGRVAANAIRQRIALIPPGQWHHLDASGSMAFLYLDADDRAWRSLAASLENDVDPAPLIAACDAVWRDATAPDDRWRELLHLLRLPAVRDADDGLRAAMAAVQRDPAGDHPVSRHAAACGCSISTFQRRFSAHAGLPWRRWRRWQRLRHAAQAVCAGRDLTTAALDAGFASGAHFSDAFRDTFGLPPSRLVEWRVGWRSID